MSIDSNKVIEWKQKIKRYVIIKGKLSDDPTICEFHIEVAEKEHKQVDHKMQTFWTLDLVKLKEFSEW